FILHPLSFAQPHRVNTSYKLSKTDWNDPSSFILYPLRNPMELIQAISYLKWVGTTFHLFYCLFERVKCFDIFVDARKTKHLLYHATKTTKMNLSTPLFQRFYHRQKGAHTTA